MMPPILECGIFKVCYGPVGANNRLFVECCECSTRPQYKVTLAQTGNLYRHVKTHHPDLKYKIKLKKIEQQCIRKEQRNEKNETSQNTKISREEEEREGDGGGEGGGGGIIIFHFNNNLQFKFIEEKKALKKGANPTTPRSFWPKA